MEKNNKLQPKVDKIKEAELAVFAYGGKQYVARVGQKLTLETLPKDSKGILIVKDLITGKTINLKEESVRLNSKISIWKFKNKTRYLRRSGHRQKQAIVTLDSII